LRNYDPRQSASAMFSETFVRCQSADPIIPTDLRLLRKRTRPQSAHL